MRTVSFAAGLALLSCVQAGAATFGNVVVIGGHASDLALDESRGKLYIANFGGRRVDVMSTSDQSLGHAIPVSGEPASLALSPDGRYLLITNYDNCPPAPGAAPCSFLTPPATTPQLTIIDMVANTRQTVDIPPASPPPATPPAPPSIPLAMAFGKGSKALLVTTTAIFLVDPTTKQPTFVQQQLPPLFAGQTLTAGPLPVPFAMYPPQIVQASTGVSGDGEVIYVVAAGPPSGPQTVVVRYDIRSSTFSGALITSTPLLGPRDISVDQHGLNFLVGWALYNPEIVLLAEFPYPTGALNIGGHAYDFVRNVIYADVPSANGAGPPVLHVLDTDNLTVRERINLAENLGGRSLFSRDMNTLYAISDSGVTVFPVGSFASQHRVATKEEQLLFQATSCTNGLLTQTLHVYDLGGGQVDFNLSVPSATNGVTISPSSGTTPADVTIQVDPSVFETQTGTTVVPLTIQSNGSIGIPPPVRLLINTKQPNQRGIIHSLPGKIVDILADNPRGRIYALRQDRNQVLVLNGATFNQVAILRTGNTPTQMTFTRDSRYLIVANDNSQIANVFDLDTLRTTPFLVFPSGHYPRSIGVSNSSIFGISRNAGTPPGLIDEVDFRDRVGTTPNTLGIFTDTVPPDSIMIGSPSGGSIFTAMANGTVLLFDDAYQAFEASRQDLTALAGSYGAISDSLFMAGGDLFNRSMVADGSIAGTTADSSILISSNNALTINAAAATAPGVFQKVSLSASGPQPPVQTIEAPVTKTILTTPPIGQIGETILSFLRTEAFLKNGTTVYLSISGLVELPANFDQPVAFPVITSVVNMADGGQVAPGSLIVISGSGLSASSAMASGLPLPTNLAETCATVNNIPVPLSLVSPGHIDGQMPYEVVGSGTLVVTSPGGQSGPFSLNVLPNAPAVFRNGQAGSLTGLPTIYRAANNQLVDNSNPIHPDDMIVIIATGLGQTSPGAVDGAAAPAQPLETATTTPAVSLGSAGLSVAFAGLVPGQVGVYQINALVPHHIAAGAQVPLVIQQGGITTSFTVRVVNP